MNIKLDLIVPDCDVNDTVSIITTSIASMDNFADFIGVLVHDAKEYCILKGWDDEVAKYDDFLTLFLGKKLV